VSREAGGGRIRRRMLANELGRGKRRKKM